VPKAAHPTWWWQAAPPLRAIENNQQRASQASMATTGRGCVRQVSAGPRCSTASLKSSAAPPTYGATPARGPSRLMGIRPTPPRSHHLGQVPLPFAQLGPPRRPCSHAARPMVQSPSPSPAIPTLEAHATQREKVRPWHEEPKMQDPSRSPEAGKGIVRGGRRGMGGQPPRAHSRPVPPTGASGRVRRRAKSSRPIGRWG